MESEIPCLNDPILASRAFVDLFPGLVLLEWTVLPACVHLGRGVAKRQWLVGGVDGEMTRPLRYGRNRGWERREGARLFL